MIASRNLRLNPHELPLYNSGNFHRESVTVKNVRGTNQCKFDLQRIGSGGGIYRTLERAVMHMKVCMSLQAAASDT